MSDIIITKDELNKEIILKKIVEEINKETNLLTEEDKNLVLKHTYPQIENYIDRLAETDFSLEGEEPICISEVKSDAKGNMNIKDSLLRRAEIPNSKEGVFEFIEEICIAATNYSVKGVLKSYGYR